MNLKLYRIIGETLNAGIEKSYRAGLASIVKLNKKEILRLKDEPELFKINYTGTDNAMLMNFRVEAFTVAGVMSYELQEKLKQLALDLQEGKHPLTKGEKSIKDVWVAEAQNIMSNYIPVKDMPPPAHLNTNLRTAMQSSYHAAQYNRLQDESVKELYPAYQYKTLADARVRESHNKLHDKIWRNNDEVWSHIWPPNGWNCRCYVKPVNVEEVNNSAIEPVTDSDTVRQAIVTEGKIGKDFDRNPGQSRSIWGKWLNQKYQDVNYYNKFKEVFDYSRSLAKYDSKNLLDSILQKNIGEYKFKELNDETWKQEFPGNIVDTPIGQARFIRPKGYDSQAAKLIEKDDNRKKYFGLIKDTFNNPTMIILDDRKGLLFVRTFRDKNDIIIIGVGQKEGEIIELKSVSRRQIRNLFNKIKNGEVLHFSDSALATFTEIPRKHFTFGSDLLNYSKINFSVDIRNIKITAETLNENHVKNILTTANEIWGETYNNGAVNSELHFIRYRVEGFQLVKVNNNEAYEIKFYGYDKINEYRKGVALL